MKSHHCKTCGRKIVGTIGLGAFTEGYDRCELHMGVSARFRDNNLILKENNRLLNKLFERINDMWKATS